ncbi:MULTISPECIES: paraquat-inducible protein A [unclassified Shinella]|uniref:paraquat-inducible protein A n=1 Tax=unclassified Shinella TaxID=2643062 RepID=UPI000680AB16|nr:paraquat-inducible protein A [Shinella sp. SUS2]KOC72887.1 paraquat-inducible protein A [Shinella sp. GWS1]
MQGHRNQRWPAMILVVPVLLVLSALFLAFGLVLPLVRFEKLYFFDETPSLIDIVVSLWAQESGGLAVLVALFSIVFPVVKLFAIALEATAPAPPAGKASWLTRLLPILGKWSMMDVMLVALVIVAAKTSGMASAFTQPGLWFYAASAIMTGLLQMKLRPHGARP